MVAVALATVDQLALQIREFKVTGAGLIVCHQGRTFADIQLGKTSVADIQDLQRGIALNIQIGYLGIVQPKGTQLLVIAEHNIGDVGESQVQLLQLGKLPHADLGQGVAAQIDHAQLSIVAQIHAGQVAIHAEGEGIAIQLLQQLEVLDAGQGRHAISIAIFSLEIVRILVFAAKVDHLHRADLLAREDTVMVGVASERGLDVVGRRGEAFKRERKAPRPFRANGERDVGRSLRVNVFHRRQGEG